MSSAVWPVVHAERAALVTDLEGLAPEEWETPSLCADWTVHDVVGHLVDNACTTLWGTVRALVSANFDFDRMNAQGVVRGRGDSPEETLAKLRAVVGNRRTPPLPLESRLVEEIVHGEDVRRPLGIARRYPRDAVALALAHQLATSDAMGGVRRRAAHVRFEATDTDLVVGTGRLVRGPVLELLLLVTGRGAHTRDLVGGGVDAFAR